MTQRVLIIFVLLIQTCMELRAQKTISYKQADSIELFMDVYYPPNFDSTKKYTAIVFFFGGGWVNGDRKQFAHHADYFSKRGAVCFLPDYRTKQHGKASPFESLMDAKSAIRFIRGHAGQFSIDPQKIIASGGSAGGQLAAACALTTKFNDNKDDLSVSCIPDALVLYNPVLDNGPGGYGYELIGDQYKDFSPLHNLKKAAPPTLLFLGTKDKLVTVASLTYYQSVMEKLGSRCELKLYEGEQHGFFNYNKKENFKKTVSETDKFLQSLGYLASGPEVVIE